MPSFKSGIFTPATRLLQLMPIASKFFLILLVFIIPLGYLSLNSVEDKQQQVDFYTTQRSGLDMVHSAYLVLPKLMQLRDAEYAAEFGYIDERIDVSQTVSEIESALEGLIGNGSVTTQQQLAEVSRLWQQSQQNRDNALSRHNHYSMITLTMRQYLLRLAEDYDILLGRDLHAYQLSHINIDSMLYTLDLVSGLRGLGAGVISRGNFTPDSFIKMSYYAGELEKTLTTVERAYKASDASQMEDSMLYKNAQQVLTNSRNFLRVTHLQVIDPDSFTLTARNYYQQATRALTELQSLHDQTGTALKHRVDENITKQKWQKNEIIFISALITLLMLYLFAGFYYAMKQGIHQINTTLAAIAKGDFSQRAEACGRDEIRQIADNLNNTADQINKLVKIAYSK
ncbi:MAG: HAMP domain-containing protein [Gammaproteobacteria bacterium]|nr:HAMP domain-containing protein [Gammaproteobacteria bacterium]